MKSEPFNSPPHQKPKHQTLFFTFVVFLILIIMITFFAFSSPSNKKSKITGFSVKESESIFKISGELTTPDLELNNNFKRIELTSLGSDDILYVGNEKFDLSEVPERKIAILEFAGKISFNDKRNLNIDGKAKQVLINGIPATSQSGDKIKIKVSDNFLYNSLTIKEINLRALSYTTTGILYVNDELEIKLHEDSIDIRNFEGDLEAQELSFKINGQADKLSVRGDIKLDIS